MAIEHAPVNRLSQHLARAACALLATLSLPGGALAQESAATCGPLTNAFGPFDYRTEFGNPKSLVESAHFTPQVEALVKGNAGYLGGDIDYTLRAFPNNHRALLAMQRLAERSKAAQAPNARYTAECYYIRAITFRPDDNTARMLFAAFLGKQQRKPEAMTQLAYVAEHVGDNAFTAYNLALMYMELGAPDKALVQAHRAQALGFMKPELKAALVKAGKWTEPPPDSAAPGASAPAVAPVPVLAPAPASPAAAAASAP